MNDPVKRAEAATETRTAQVIMLDQQLALSAYLQALLQPAPVEVVTEAVAVPVVVSEPVMPPVPVLETPVIEEVAATVSATIELEQPAQSVPAPQPTVSSAAYPEWAQSEFQCLLFRVAGLTLALPLAKLNGVLTWDAAAVTPMPNHQPWFLGLREHLGRQVKLIDVAKVVLPPERAGAAGVDPGAELGKVILIDDGRWGLACTEVAEVITLSAAAVKWRKREGAGAGGRPWLAGAVIEHMCALIDTAAFAGMLNGDAPMPA